MPDQDILPETNDHPDEYSDSKALRDNELIIIIGSGYPCHDDFHETYKNNSLYPTFRYQ